MKPATLFVLFWIATFLGLTACNTPQGEAAATGPDLNLKVANVRQGMSKAEVTAILGEPRWVGLPSDRSDYGVRDQETAFILYWRNTGFPVVQVHFDADHKVRWDTGWSGQETYTHVFEPRDNFLCSNPERATYCNPTE
ncbi:outer membrane protein assembly factor BamE domain-containing protein [Acanthopleuribacter pedis]|uniref:Outer membrane protein assembly factor BamE domain-containing protein n=1 Tax=Acanthopleuribacter pedis TaxID=442870 RepID=A0A8J7QFV1_9BACT|nr:outer membrane protein assembly factor BamE [Acanthopleuribacter pedis]MBO1317710.1 hypothetical protein [Acanthopleuribacter pedis]